MTFASLAKEIPLPVEQALPIYAVALGLLYACVIVYRKLLRGIRLRGGQVRSDLFGLPDTIVVGAFVAMIVLALAMQWLFRSSSGPQWLQIASTVLFLALPPILALMVIRGLSLPTMFGLQRLGLFRVIGVAVGLIVLLLPVIMIVTAITYQILDGHAEQQDLVMKFREAAKAGKRDILWQVFTAAAVVAPLVEEFLFRGYFYPVLKRLAGPLPAAITVSLLFGAIHNNAAAFPVLTVLALALTLAYEWSGSLFVPILMHACFNTMMLALMWWQTAHSATP